MNTHFPTDDSTENNEASTEVSQYSSTGFEAQSFEDSSSDGSSSSRSGDAPSGSSSNNDQPIGVGSQVIYGLNGKCEIVAQETKTVGGEAIEFFKLKVLKAQLSRSKKVEPFIWAPINQAKKQGLRKIIQASDIDAIMKVIHSEDIYFDVNEDFRTLSKKLEKCIFDEGAIGLAKVVSFFEGFRIKNPIPNPEVNRFDQIVFKLLSREMAEVLDQSIKSQEDKIKRGLSNKNLGDEYAD